jgi:hypothetical protein
MFVWLISHQPAVLFSQNKPVINNQPAVLFSQNKSAAAISHQPNEQADSSPAASQRVLTCCNAPRCGKINPLTRLWGKYLSTPSIMLNFPTFSPFSPSHHIKYPKRHTPSVSSLEVV